MPTETNTQSTTAPFATKITTILRFCMSDGTFVDQELKSVPQDGVNSMFAWVSTQTKPNPIDHSGPPWNKWQNSPTDTQMDIACNFANDLILSQVKQIVTCAPPPSVVAASQAVTVAQVAYQVELDKACGLIDPPAKTTK
jgi:hypothetical protein